MTSLRPLLLRVLFVSLAAAAILGALGILLASYSVIGRVAGTSVVTAVAAGLLLLAVPLLDKPPTRAAGLLAVALLVIEYLLVLGSLWDLYGMVGRADEKVIFTIVELAACGVPAVAFLRMTATRLTAVAGRAGLALAGAELLLLLGLTWGSSDFAHVHHFDELAAYLAAAAALAVPCLIGAGTDRRHWRWVGVAAVAAAYAVAANSTLTYPRTAPPKLLLYLATLAAAVAHANVLMSIPLRASHAWLRVITIAAAVAALGAVDLTVYTGSYRGDALIERLGGAAAIVAGCGTVALAVLARLNVRALAPVGGAGDALAAVKEVALTCPICRRKQSVPLGRGPVRCGGCNLVLEVRAEEPRCAACGYSLLMFTGGACPECGAAVAAAIPSLPPRVTGAGGAVTSEVATPG